MFCFGNVVILNKLWFRVILLLTPQECGDYDLKHTVSGIRC